MAADTPDATELDQNTRLFIGHFDEFVNKRDLTAIDRNVAEDFLDHDGPGGKPAGMRTATFGEEHGHSLAR